MVQEVASTDLGKMGIEIMSFTLKKVNDDVQFLDSLGKTQTALVMKDADIGVAEANRDTGIKQAECQREADDVKYSTDSKIELNKKVANLEKAAFDAEVNTALAIANLAYNLQGSQIDQDLKKAEVYIDIVERKKKIEVEEKEIERKSKELMSTVRLPAEAEAFKTQTIAEGMKTKALASAKGEAEMIKLIGEAEANANEVIGKAEAEGMRVKAEAYKQYGEAALVAMVLENMPEIAHEVAKPLGKTKDIVLIGGGDKTAQFSSLLAGLPTSVAALAGNVVKQRNDKQQAWSGQDTSYQQENQESNVEAFFRKTFGKIPPVDAAVAGLTKLDDDEFSSLIFNSPNRSQGRSVCHH